MSDFENAEYDLYVLEKIRRGLERAEKEKTLTQAEVKVRISKLLKGRSDYELADSD